MLGVESKNAYKTAHQSDTAAVPRSNDRDLIDHRVTLAVTLGVD